MCTLSPDFFGAFLLSLNKVMKIRCTTLYDITKTDVNFRRNKLDRKDDDDFKGSQQSNYETILQCIGIRAQPEDISMPIKDSQRLSQPFGKKYKSKDFIPMWSFTFVVQQHSVFQLGEDELGGLYEDCDHVPMIIGLEEWNGLSGLLNINNDLKNIHFEVIDEKNTL